MDMQPAFSCCRQQPCTPLGRADCRDMLRTLTCASLFCPSPTCPAWQTLRIDQAGKTRRVYVRRRDLIRAHGLQPRDLRRVDPSLRCAQMGVFGSSTCSGMLRHLLLQLWRRPARACLPVLQQLLRHGVGTALHGPALSHAALGCCPANASAAALLNLPACCAVHPSLPLPPWSTPCTAAL